MSSLYLPSFSLKPCGYPVGKVDTRAAAAGARATAMQLWSPQRQAASDCCQRDAAVVEEKASMDFAPLFSQNEEARSPHYQERRGATRNG